MEMDYGDFMSSFLCLSFQMSLANQKFHVIALSCIIGHTCLYVCICACMKLCYVRVHYHAYMMLNTQLELSWIFVQVASQVIRWLHEEAVTVGIKATRDFLCLSFELEQGERLSLVAHVDPEDTQGCISWWLVMEDRFTEERKLQTDISDSGSDYRKFLGHLSLDVLYSTLMDLVNLCNGGTNL